MTTSLTSDWRDADVRTLCDIANECGCPVMTLFIVCWFESGATTTSRNKNSSATGLIGFMRESYERWGYTRDEFSALPIASHLARARGWFLTHRGRLATTVDAYLAVLLPACVGTGSNEDAVQCIDAWRLAGKTWVKAEQKFPSFARDNPAVAERVVERNDDGVEVYRAVRITTRTIARALAKSEANGEATSARFRELRSRILAAEAERMARREAAAPAIAPGLAGVQQALGLLAAATGRQDWDPGPADGQDGPRTRAAVIAYQRARRMVADGVAGPKTRAQLVVDIGELPVKERSA